ncbi:MAG: hypothetical protein ACLPY5_00360 [Candidatus Bathyarchaeia archaeon]
MFGLPEITTEASAIQLVSDLKEASEFVKRNPRITRASVRFMPYGSEQEKKLDRSPIIVLYQLGNPLNPAGLSSNGLVPIRQPNGSLFFL